MSQDNETIVAAANMIRGLTLSLPKPAGHGEIMALTYDALGDFVGSETQGFLTSTGRFVTRVEAMKIAHRAGQAFRSKERTHELFSEDLW